MGNMAFLLANAGLLSPAAAQVARQEDQLRTAREKKKQEQRHAFCEDDLDAAGGPEEFIRVAKHLLLSDVENVVGTLNLVIKKANRFNDTKGFVARWYALRDELKSVAGDEVAGHIKNYVFETFGM